MEEDDATSVEAIVPSPAENVPAESYSKDVHLALVEWKLSDGHINAIDLAVLQIAKYGICKYPWVSVKPALIFKFDSVLTDFLKTSPYEPLDGEECLEFIKTSIIDRLTNEFNEFVGFSYSTSI